MSYYSKGFRVFVAAYLTLLAASVPQRAFAAPNTSGLHAFFNDDRNQFVDLWQNTNGQITIKVSNGRPWQPMWVVVHANFFVGEQMVARKDYHVFAPSPRPGGHGEERWFHFGHPGVGATEIIVTTNKEAPWGKPQGGWEIEVSGTFPAP